VNYEEICLMSLETHLNYIVNFFLVFFYILKEAMGRCWYLRCEYKEKDFEKNQSRKLFYNHLLLSAQKRNYFEFAYQHMVNRGRAKKIGNLNIIFTLRDLFFLLNLDLHSLGIRSRKINLIWIHADPDRKDCSFYHCWIRSKPVLRIQSRIRIRMDPNLFAGSDWKFYVVKLEFSCLKR